jgi:hypothetical protein
LTVYRDREDFENREGCFLKSALMNSMEGCILLS